MHRVALRGPALTFVGDPFVVGPERAVRHEPDALIAIEEVVTVPAHQLAARSRLPASPAGGVRPSAPSRSSSVRRA